MKSDVFDVFSDALLQLHERFETVVRARRRLPASAASRSATPAALTSIDRSNRAQWRITEQFEPDMLLADSEGGEGAMAQLLPPLARELLIVPSEREIATRRKGGVVSAAVLVPRA